MTSNVEEKNGNARTAARVYLLVDNRMIAAGFESLLARGRFDVVGGCEDPVEAMAELHGGSAHIVLIDLRHPQSDCFQWAVRFREEFPDLRILVVRENPAPDQVTHVLRAGIDCVLPASGGPPELFIALDSLHRGYTYLSPSLHPTVSAHGGGIPSGFAARSVVLTEREIEIVRLLALGRTSGEIAEEWGAPEGEVKEMMEKVGRELDCHSAAGFARLAIREGYLPR
jgi:DNA-binding NarL/FixJ family response regulator